MLGERHVDEIVDGNGPDVHSERLIAPADPLEVTGTGKERYRTQSLPPVRNIVSCFARNHGQKCQLRRNRPSNGLRTSRLPAETSFDTDVHDLGRRVALLGHVQHLKADRLCQTSGRIRSI